MLYLQCAVKKCPKCLSKHTKKNGHHRGIQKYICLDCKDSFSSQRRSDKLQNIIFNHYFYQRQTAPELALKYHRSERWIRGQIHKYKVIIKQRIPRGVVLVMDTTFFGKRIDKFSLIVAKDTKALEPISYHFIHTESMVEYSRLKSSILSQGFTIQSITIDGKRGLFSLFANTPVQMCHFHQQAIITRYLTRKPKLVLR